MLSEFDLIARYFTRPRPHGRSIALGIGDDCALLAPAPGKTLAVSTDMLVEGRHFLAGADPAKLGHKSLAVNLSDLAAMGARPLAFTLALALPQARAEWLAPFAEGLFALADQHQCDLIGGDTTKGPLTICITVFGELAPAAGLRRDAAHIGDDIWVSGSLGDARLALGGLRGELALEPDLQRLAEQRMHCPSPRVALGLALAGVAHAAIDVSDGLAGDLGHILRRSQCGATLAVDTLPAGPILRRQALALRRQFTLAGGDDYELCFTAAPAKRGAVLAAAQTAGVAVTRVGVIDAEAGLRTLDADGTAIDLQAAGFDHFTAP